MIAYPVPRRKYGNTRVQHGSDHWHDSVRELRHCEMLALLKLAGEIQGYTVHPHYTLHALDGSKVCGFIPDFLVTVKEGQFVHVHCEDVKGYVAKDSAPWKIFEMKRKLFEAEYGIPVRVVT